MDELEEFIHQNLLSKTSILHHVDSYSLFCNYVGYDLELNTKYSSPLREGDSDPSFSIYYSKYREDVLYFKDQALGFYGDVFLFLQLLFSKDPDNRVSMEEVLIKISIDFDLGIHDPNSVSSLKKSVLKSKPKKKTPTEIRITKRPKRSELFTEFFNRLGIKNDVLKEYYCEDVAVVHYKNNMFQNSLPFSGLTISYEILGKYKIYRPYDLKEFKFRNNYLDNFIEGALQLQFKKDFLLITKSTKEIMFFRSHFGWECVAGLSESKVISKHFMDIAFSKYKYVFVWLDNDDTGRAFQLKYKEEYPNIIPVYFSPDVQDKDPTDLYLRMKESGKEEQCLNYLKNLINYYKNGRTTS
tara:strand:+ start:883 stop:1947 length:1065 start_codon:yes stop_codon:yes gene_type:complete